MNARLLIGITSVFALLAPLAGCGGYGDETGGGRQGDRPPLAQMKDLNAWLAAYQKQFGAAPKTYEELVALYEKAGQTWPPFPDGGSWVYFPQHAKVVEVREDWVLGYLQRRSRPLVESRYYHNEQSAERYVREHEGVSVRPPGYLVTFLRKGSEMYFTIDYQDDGVTAKHGNHTANDDFTIDEAGDVQAVQSMPKAAGTP